MEFATFLSSSRGRATRIGTGVALVVAGLALGGAWLILSLVGLVPVATGGADVCLVAPIAGRPFKGPGA